MSGDLTGFVLLAAGNSSRLGQPKALLTYGSTTLIGHCIAQMRAVGGPIVVVTGAHCAEIEKNLDPHAVSIVHNPAWREGMASSIRCGVEALCATANPSSIILAVCDQPALDAALLRAMIEQKTSGGCPIVACQYGDTIGVPALFDRHYFAELCALPGEGGAKSLLSMHADKVALVPFPGGALDIDTPEDYARWQAGSASD